MPFRIRPIPTLVLGCFACLLLGGASAQAADRIYFTTKADHDVYSARVDGSDLTRHTRTIGNTDLNENFPTARGGRLLYHTQVSSATAAFFGNTWYFASGSRYDLVQQRGRKATLPLYARYTARKVRNSRRFARLAAPAFAPSGRLRVALNCTTPGIKSELCVYDFRRRRLAVLTRCDCVADGGSPTRLSWSRNGRYIAFAQGQAIWRYDLGRKRLERVFNAPRQAETASDFYDHATISPDGGTVAARYSDGASASGLVLIDLLRQQTTRLPSPELEVVDAGDATYVTKPGAFLAAPSFSPDGKELALTVAEGYNPDAQVPELPSGVYRLDLATRQFTRIVEAERDDFDSTAFKWSVTWGS